MKKKDIGILANEDIFKLIGKEWMLVSAGTIDNFNVSVSAMMYQWHNESRVVCPAILFSTCQGGDSCILQVSDA